MGFVCCSIFGFLCGGLRIVVCSFVLLPLSSLLRGYYPHSIQCLACPSSRVSSAQYPVFGLPFFEGIIRTVSSVWPALLRGYHPHSIQCLACTSSRVSSAQYPVFGHSHGLLGTDHLTCRGEGGGGGGGGGVLWVFFFVQQFFFGQHELEYLSLLSRKARIIFPEHNIRLYDKNLHQNQNIFSATLGIRIFF